ncbi:hypothetical protein PaG_05210 [Moesziomyces aphidis]|uniref:Uncharacterized protein n=1 Tax=Moesziomyces aphidis TaxID=84754 RepID=W3VHY3_MOEAP|nr:hypothetical protein PaG_05210 [Moesziomyces aphidis]
MEISATPPAGGKVKEGAAETRLLMVPHDASAALNAELRPAAVRGWHSAAVSDERADHRFEAIGSPAQSNLALSSIISLGRSAALCIEAASHRFA